MLASETDRHYEKGFVCGSFDLFHIGHLNLLRNAKRRCDYLQVAVLTDKSIIGYKKRPPAIPLAERMEIIRELRCVDDVDVITPELMPHMAMLEKFHFDAKFSGDDSIGKPDWVEAEKQYNRLGVDLVFFPYTKNRSTTGIMKDLEERLLSKIS